MRIEDFTLTSFKVRPSGVELNIEGRLEGQLPDGILSAKVGTLVGLAVKVTDSSGKTLAELDAINPTVTVDGAKKCARIKAVIQGVGDSCRAEVLDAVTVMDAESAALVLASMSQLSAAEKATREAALARVEWTPTWEEQGELDFGLERGELQ